MLFGRHLAWLAISIALLLPAAHGAAIYNYESYGNTLDGPLGQTPSGTCSLETYVSTVLSVANCSPASGVLMSADSLATYTALHADSSLSLSGASLPAGITASGYARTVDFLNASNDVAYLGFVFAVDGTLTDSGLTEALFTLNFGFAYNAGFAGQAADGCSRSIAGGTKSFSFTCATRIYPIALFQANTYFFSTSGQERVAATASPVTGSASANFFSTATITSVQAYDANMNFLPGAAVSSQGNNGSLFVDAETPEPSSWSLFAAAGTVFAVFRRKLRAR